MILEAAKSGVERPSMETRYDMHCHLGFAPEPAATAAAGATAGIGAFSCTVEPAEYERLRPVLESAPNVAVGLGAHPWWIADGRVRDAELARFCERARTTRFIGEVGLDFAGVRDTEESRALQTDAFARILAACDEAPRPVDGAAAVSDDTAMAANRTPCGKLISIHAVNAATAALDVLEQQGTLSRHQAIFHWFSGTSDDLQRAIKLGCFFSVGPRMLASRRGREYARQIPAGQLLLETDMPAREGDNLPAEVWRAELGNALSGIAQLKGIDREILARELAETSRRLLALP